MAYRAIARTSLLALCFGCAVLTAADVITTIAGNGTGSSTGDGGQASAATLNVPALMARDAAGNLYITEYSGNRIRKIDTAGIITTVAGTGVAGYSGDNGPATSAQIRTPVGIGIDSAGNIYFSEQQNHIIRKIDTAGIITTVAGSGSAGYAGDGLPASQSVLNTPASLIVDSSDNVIWSEINSYRIREIDKTSGNVITIAGTGTQGILNDNGPATAAEVGTAGGFSFAPNGDLYFVDASNERVRMISGGNITSIAGTGAPGFSGDTMSAANATFFFQNGGSANGATAVDANGNIFITDFFNNRIRRIDKLTDNIDTVHGTGSATFNGDGLVPLATGGSPLGLLLNPDGTYIYTDGNRIRKLVLNPPAPTSAGISATFLSGGVTFETRSVKDGTTVTLTSSGVPSTIPVNFSWDFGDGTAVVIGIPVTHTYNVSVGEATYTLTLTASNANGSITATAQITVSAPASGGTVNIALGGAAVTNPLADIKTKLVSSDGGVLELDVSGTVIGRAPFDVSTDLDGLSGRLATRPGFRPIQRFAEEGTFVATHRATDSGTGLEVGKVRRTIAVSKKELGSSTVTAPASHEWALNTITGRFGQAGALTGPKPDTVTYSGKIELPAGLDLTKNQSVSIAVGNIIDSASVSPKGKAILPSTLGRIKKLQVKFPKLAKGTTTTTAGQIATVTVGLSMVSMSTSGFDTEGVTNKLRSDEVGLKSASRSIQTAITIGGVAYQTLAPAQFKLSKKQDAGSISGRAAR